MPSDKFRQKHPKNRQTKIHLVFDEENRRDFLSGFQKRKKERKKLAREQQEEKYKEEKQKLRLEARQALQAGRQQLQFPDELKATEDTQTEVFDNDDHTVTIEIEGGVTVEPLDLLAAHGGIGENKVEYEDDNVADKNDAQSRLGVLAACDGSDDDESSDHEEESAMEKKENNKDTAKNKSAKLLKLQKKISKRKQGGSHRHKAGHKRETNKDHGVKQRGKKQAGRGRKVHGGKRR